MTLIDSRRFLLVGECYVEGLLEGEAVESLSDRNLVGPPDPELVILEILEETRKPLGEIGWVSDTEDLDKNDKLLRIIRIARKDFEDAEKRRWYDIH